MDFKLILGFVAGHFVMVAGTTLALFFTTCTILLIRSIGQKEEGSHEGGGHASSIDVETIEGAMKRVLASQPITIAHGSTMAEAPTHDSDTIPLSIDPMTPAPAASSAASGDGEKLQALQAQLKASEVRIEKLVKDLQAAKSAGGAAAPAGGANEEGAAYLAKIDELQARLAEYEIIEDDIADLSMYKEENARMKEQIAAYKAAAPAGAAAPTAVAPPNAAAPASEPAAAVIEALAAPSEAAVKFEKSDTFELDPNDDVMKEFAAAVSEQRAPAPAAASKIDDETSSAALSPVDAQSAIDSMLNPPTAAPPMALVAKDATNDATNDATDNDPLAGTPDPEKMLSEVESLVPPESDADAGSNTALDDSMDTDKLLAEVDQLKAATPGTDVEDAFSHFDKAAQG